VKTPKQEVIAYLLDQLKARTATLAEVQSKELQCQVDQTFGTYVDWRTLEGLKGQIKELDTWIRHAHVLLDTLLALPASPPYHS
jgi:hypothetical protein